MTLTAVFMRKIRINELARELEVKAHEILELLPELGVAEKKTHSSSIDEDVAIKLRRHYGHDVADLAPEVEPAIENHEPAPLASAPNLEPLAEVVHPAPKPVVVESVAVAPPAPPKEAEPLRPVEEHRPAAPIRPPLAGRPVHPPLSGASPSPTPPAAVAPGPR